VFNIEKILGIGIYTWIALICAVLFSTIAHLFVFKEKIKKIIYLIKRPQALIKVVLHLPTGYFIEYWRLIPNNKTFTIGKQVYLYIDKSVINPHKKDNTQELNDLNIKSASEIKKRFSKYPEIHYTYNNPNPIDFIGVIKGKSDLNFNATELKLFKETDLFTKMLSLAQQDFLLVLNLIFSGIVILLLIISLAQQFGLFDKIKG